jgi:hypothetical protein
MQRKHDIFSSRKYHSSRSTGQHAVTSWPLKDAGQKVDRFMVPLGSLNTLFALRMRPRGKAHTVGDCSLSRLHGHGLPPSHVKWQWNFQFNMHSSIQDIISLGVGKMLSVS